MDFRRAVWIFASLPEVVVESVLLWLLFWRAFFNQRFDICFENSVVPKFNQIALIDFCGIATNNEFWFERSPFVSV